MEEIAATAVRLSTKFGRPIDLEWVWDGSEVWLTAEMVGWRKGGHQPLAGGGESRRPKGVSNS